MIAHIVLFEPKPGIDTDSRRAFAQLLRRCCEAAPSIRRAFIGRSIEINARIMSQVGHKTYSYASVFEFDDRGGLAEYLGSESHQELAKMFWELCAETAIIDVETTDVISGNLDDLLV